MKVIRTIKGGDGRALEEYILLGEFNDIILLKPGTYTVLKAIEIAENFEIKGLGNDPSEVIIHGQLNITGKSKVKISNVTIQAPHKYNGINVKDDSEVLLDKVMVHGEE